MKEKANKTKETLALQAERYARSAGTDVDVVWTDSPIECVLIPGDYNSYLQLVIALILGRKLDEDDLSTLFDYLYSYGKNQEEACKRFVKDSYDVE